MTMPLTVGNDQVGAYSNTVSFLASRYDGLHNAEYDDLYQEGMLQVFSALRIGVYPAKDLIAKRMTKWVNICARRGLATNAPLSEFYSTDTLESVFDQ